MAAEALQCIRRQSTLNSVAHKEECPSNDASTLQEIIVNTAAHTTYKKGNTTIEAGTTPHDDEERQRARKGEMEA